MTNRRGWRRAQSISAPASHAGGDAFGVVIDGAQDSLVPLVRAFVGLLAQRVQALKQRVEREAAALAFHEHGGTVLLPALMLLGREGLRKVARTVAPQQL